MGVGGGMGETTTGVDDSGGALLSEVLQWDFFRLMKEQRENIVVHDREGYDAVEEGKEDGVEAQLSKARERRRAGGNGKTPIQHLSDTFSDPRKYCELFEPLVLEECAANIVKGGDEDGDYDTCRGVAREFRQERGFQRLMLAVEEDAISNFTWGDIALLSEEFPSEAIAERRPHMLAYVENLVGKQSVQLLLNLDPNTSIQQTSIGEWRTTRRNLTVAARRRLTDEESSVWWCCKLCNLSTVKREWIALHEMEKSMFVRALTEGKLARGNQRQAWRIPLALERALGRKYDASQCEAIKSGMSSDPIVLIQGPPGTGKTMTLLGLLSVILHSKPNAGTYVESNLSEEEEETIEVEKKQISDEEISANNLKILRRNQTNMFARYASRPVILPMEVTHAQIRDAYRKDKPLLLDPKAKKRVRILVCAPSNGAVDEIAHRIMTEGILDETGNFRQPRIVRIGMPNSIHEMVNDISMASLTEKRLNSMEKRVNHNGLQHSAFSVDRTRIAILDEAEIVCSTLSYSGSNFFARMTRGFDVVVIDEAAQAVEPSTLVPLQHGCQQLFLVGDPQQLPATVLSTRAIDNGYERSLFERFQSLGYPVHLLETQYRMHPSISSFPSKQFYDGKVKNGDTMALLTMRAWHEHRFLGPFALIDAKKTREQVSGRSWMNELQGSCIIELVKFILKHYDDFPKKASLGIISPYKGQVRWLKHRLVEELGDEVARSIDVNSVDGFQGREKDLIIFSTVRTRGKGKIGFVRDPRRMNVGMTRAKTSLIVVGDTQALRAEAKWGNLTQYAEEGKCIFRCDGSKPANLCNALLKMK